MASNTPGVEIISGIVSGMQGTEVTLLTNGETRRIKFSDDKKMKYMMNGVQVGVFMTVSSTISGPKEIAIYPATQEEGIGTPPEMASRIIGQSATSHT